MIRRILVITSLAAFASLLALSCKESGGASAGDGGDSGTASGHAPKLICKMNNQCWICPDDAAMKKCIINPATSGCKQSSDGDCR
jgi:hypothetical protein